MSTALTKKFGILCLAAGVCVATLFVAGAAPNTGGKAVTVYQYKVVSSDMKSLPSELDKLGKSGWNVVSVVRDDLVLAQEDGKNHIRTAQVTVVAKRRDTGQ